MFLNFNIEVFTQSPEIIQLFSWPDLAAIILKDKKIRFPKSLTILNQCS